jgi:two-component system sensor histidine kinase ChvG
LAIVGILIALPVLLYGQFESADRQTRDLVTRSIQDRSRLIAEALTPLLRQVSPPPYDVLEAELRKFVAEGTALRLVLQPAMGQGERAFYLVAAMPRLEAGQVGGELDELAQRGILRRLSDSCIWESHAEIRYRQANGKVEILTSLNPIQSPAGCWVLISTHATSEFLDSSIGRPYWQTREVQVAALIYLSLAIVAALVVVSIRRSLRRFRAVAHEIRQGRIGECAFAARNVVPELASVARDFDRLVLDLRRVARDMRQTAEDNAHSFKTPLATIQSALEPIRRQLPANEPRSQRALAIIDSSVDRLKGLINAAQRLDINTADVIDAPRKLVDLTRLVADTIVHYREMLAGRNIRVVRRLDDEVMVRAGDGMLEIVVQNILDNAVSFSGPGTTIMVTLAAAAGTADLRVEDQGPGIASDRIDRIFERYFSARCDAAEGANTRNTLVPGMHAGLGLWIVRRNVEALGGRVTAANRLGGGLSIRVSLPCNGGR